MSDINELSFEAAYAQLEGIVTKLESGELSLEESVNMYEQGKKLSDHCQKILDDAELRVNQINDEGEVSAL
jgi:exodeoxyribonuclease VII small subunit